MTKCKEGKYAMGPYRKQASDNNMYRIDCGEMDWGVPMTVIARTDMEANSPLKLWPYVGPTQERGR